MLTQKQMFYQESRKLSEVNELFLHFVEDGMTRQELEENINRRPGLWGRFSNWLEVLPHAKLS